MTHRTLTTAAAMLAMATSAALAQPKAAAGLDALDESRVQSELASRGLDTLLDYSFEQSKTPEAQRAGVRTLAALRQLSDKDAKLTAKERQDVIAQVTKGIEGALPNLTDGKLLMQQAGTLINEGVNPDLNTLEYWGESAKLQASLRPLTETVQKIYDKAAVEAQAESDRIANQLSGNNPALEKKWEEADGLVTMAKFTKAMSAYNLARSIDKADPRRKVVADEAIAFLTPYDSPDTQVQPQARLRIAKLNLAKGDFSAAKKLFDSIESDAAKLEPKPDVYQRYEARYFGAQSLMFAGDVSGAKKALADLQTWQKANLPESARTGADAAARMLDFRIASTEAEKATGAAKEKANDAAIATLVGIVKDYPQYKSIIFEQLLDRIPANADLSKLDPLLLSAIMRKGQVELAKTGGEVPDTKAIEAAVNAATEIVKRKGKGTDDSIVKSAMLARPYLLMKLEKKGEAGLAFMDYVDAYPQDKEAEQAVNNAGALMFDLQRANAADATLASLSDRFLPIAIDKFGHKALAYTYAARLRELEKYKDAVKYFRMVPDTDANGTRARYFEMLALKQQLDADTSKSGSASRKSLVADIQKLADSVNKLAPAALASSKSDAERGFYRLMPARTALLAADLSKREMKDAKRTLQLLGNFEADVKAAPENVADQLLSEALFLRVGANMELGQTDKATTDLVTLLNQKGGQQGLQIVFDLIMRLDQDFSAALISGDVDAQRVIAKNRADLSGYLVTWAAGNKDPKIKQYTYRYRVFDASSKQIAADLDPNADARKKGLIEAQKLFTDLQSPENVALYKQTIPTGGDPNYPDVQVMLGLAKVQYDLGNYKEAAPLFSRLLNDNKLGSEKKDSVVNGERVRADNDQYWEATLKQLSSFARAAKATPDDAKSQSTLTAAQNRLKQLYVKSGKAVGGKKWAGDFEKLRKEIIPDYVIPDIDALPTPTTGPTTAPVAQGAP